MHLDPVAVLAGAVVLWLIVVATSVVVHRTADAQAAKAAFTQGFPLTKLRPASRAGVRFLLAILIAGSMAAMESLLRIRSVVDAMAIGMLLMIVPATFTCGFGYGAKVPVNATLRVVGLFAAGIATSVVMFSVAQHLR